MTGLNENNYLEYQKLFNSSSPEYQRYLTDFRNHPLWVPHESEYRNIKYKIKRVDISHLCGYVLYDGYSEFTKEERDEIEEESCHCDFTAGFGGFDCAHYGDYHPGPFEVGLGGTYKNFDYVKMVIERIIDHIYRLRPEIDEMHN